MPDFSLAEAEAAALRRAFNRAAETWPRNHPMPEAVQAWWGALYEAITSNRAGLDILAELARLREEAKR